MWVIFLGLLEASLPLILKSSKGKETFQDSQA